MSKTRYIYILISYFAFFLFQSCTIDKNKSNNDNQLEPYQENFNLLEELNTKIDSQKNIIDSLLVEVEFSNKKNHQLIISFNNKINDIQGNFIYYDSLYSATLFDPSVLVPKA